MKRIGIDGRLWNESGVGRYIRNLVEGIDISKLDDEYVVFLSQENYSSVVFKNSKIRKAVTKARWHTLSEQFVFKKELDRFNFDLVHFPYFSYPAFYQRPFIITIHDLIIDHYPTGLASSLPLPFYQLKHLGYKAIIRSAVKNSKKIIVPTNATKEEIIDHYNADPQKINVIYEGFDPLIAGHDKKNLVSKNYILYVGNAYPHKNLDNLFRAFKYLRNEMDIDLVCIGRDDFFYRKYERENQEGIFILHNIDDSALFEYYTNARLFVMPSLMEGFGLPALEAMSLSCPVISSGTPALREVLDDAALYFDPKKPIEISRTAEKVLKDGEFSSRLVAKGRERSKKFSWKTCVDKTLNIYESCNSV